MKKKIVLCVAFVCLIALGIYLLIRYITSLIGLIGLLKQVDLDVDLDVDLNIYYKSIYKQNIIFDILIIIFIVPSCCFFAYSLIKTIINSKTFIKSKYTISEYRKEREQKKQEKLKKKIEQLQNKLNK